MTNVRRLSGLIVLPGLLSACAGAPTLGSSASAVTVAPSLGPPDATSYVSDFSDYRIGPRDELVIEVLGAPELKREVEVDSSGNLSLPMVGTVAAGGKTPSEVSAAIAGGLRGRFILNPQVTVNIKKAVGQTFTVDGSVRQPGIYPVNGTITLQQAIASAKGADDLANLDNVVVFRSVAQQRMAALFSLKQIRAGRMADPQIYGRDIVVVGENATRRFLTDLRLVPALGSFVPFM
jgi:polysaccharide export outer membrane protein